MHSEYIRKNNKSTAKQHEQLIKAAKQAINKVYGDTSVARQTVKESLKDLWCEIDIMLVVL
jgi:ribosomal protein L20